MIGVDEQTHQVYFPVQDVYERPLLRRARSAYLIDRYYMVRRASLISLWRQNYEQTPFE